MLVQIFICLTFFVELPDLFNVLEFVRKIFCLLAGLFKRKDVAFKFDRLTFRVCYCFFDALIRPLEDLNLGWRLHVVVEFAVREHVDVQILLICFFIGVFDCILDLFNVWIVAVCKYSQVAVFNLELEVPKLLDQLFKLRRVSCS